MSIRARIWCTLLLAVVLPVGACLYLMSRVSYDHAIQQAERIHDDRAKVASQAFETYLHERIRRDIDALLTSANFTLATPGSSTQWKSFESNRAEMLTQWHHVNHSRDQRLAWFIHSLPMFKFATQRTTAPELMNMLMVDPEGVVIGGTHKPQDYDQNHEEWLQTLRSSPSGTVVRWQDISDQALRGDTPLEVLVTMHKNSWYQPDNEVAAYLHLTMDFHILLSDFLRSAVGSSFQGVLTDSNGRVMASTGAFANILPGTMLTNNWRQTGPSRSAVTHPTNPNTTYLVSHAPVDDPQALGHLGMQIFSGSTVDQVVAPLRAKQWQLFGGTFAVISIGVIFSSFYMRRTISRPIEQITRMTNEIMSHSQRGGVMDEAEVEDLVRPLREVRTHDEIETLAERFLRMSVKTLGFQRRLEHEVAEKTHLIQSDLEMAREFQQALLPACPCCGSPKVHDPLELDFAHFYQPAAYVSGDFYDYLRVDDHKVAVLIGDVMGHGARSALVTAILRALVEEVAMTHTEPAAFLSALNQRYHEIIQRSGQMIFVSACYLLFDTETGSVQGASAGHPTPLLARRGERDVKHLFPITQPRFPLGMVGNVSYKSTTAAIHANDLILLYTDGVTEAESGDGEQFGEDALSAQVAAHTTMRAIDLVSDVANLVIAHSKGTMNDDVCMVAIRVLPAAA